MTSAMWIAFGALLGAIVGSFLATLIIRWPAGRSVLSGRSACDGCDRTLSPLELVPIAGFLLLRGRCRSCAAPIARDHFAIEIAAALIGGIAFALVPTVAGIGLAGLGWLLLALGWLDARHLWLPDALVILLALVGLVAAGWITAIALQDRLIGGVAGFATLEIVRRAYRRMRGHDGMGGGDPKLFGAIGLWTGWAMLPLVLLVASAGLLATALLSGTARDRSREFPLGSALAAAGFVIACLQAGGRL